MIKGSSKKKSQSPLFMDKKFGIIHFYTNDSMPLNRLSFRIALKSERLKYPSKKAGGRIEHELKAHTLKVNKTLKKEKKEKQRNRRIRKKLNIDGIKAPSYAK